MKIGLLDSPAQHPSARSWGWRLPAHQAGV